MADQQPEALAATCDLLVQQFTAFGADKKAVKEALTASAATIRTLRAQVERLQAAGQVPLGYMNAGHLHEMRQGRLPHAYLYPTEGVGVSVPVYTTPAQEAADTGADERAQIERIARAHGTGGWQTLDDMVRFGLAVRAALAASTGANVDAGMVMLADEQIKAWAARHDLKGSLVELRCIADDAASIGLTVGGIQASGRVGK